MKQIVKYDITNAAIAKMNDLYIGLVITDLGSKEEFNAVHDARMVVKGHRLSVETKRKELKADSLAWGREVDAEAKRISSLLKPIESHLATEEKRVAEEKERIQTEKERLEKIKIDDRVTDLFAVGVNIPYFEAAMLSDAEYMIKLDVATNEYNTERLRLQEEQKAKEEAEAKLEADRSEIARIKKEQEDKAKEQADKEAILEEQARGIEAAKKAEAERKERAAFEKKAKEKARIQAKKDAVEAEKKRKAKEKADQEAKKLETKTARFESLQEIGFKYPFNDLGIMPDRQYCELYDSHRKVWDAEQQAIFIAKLKKERVEKEKAEAAKKARVEALRPDKEKLIQYAASILKLNAPDIKNRKAQTILTKAQDSLGQVAQDISQQAKEL